jgi:hypothetical protein
MLLTRLARHLKIRSNRHGFHHYTLELSLGEHHDLSFDLIRLERSRNTIIYIERKRLAGRRTVQSGYFSEFRHGHA